MQPELPTRLILHGRLREAFGPELIVAGDTPATALRVAMTLHPGLRLELDNKAYYRVIRGSRRKGQALGETGLHIRLPPDNKQFHLVPLARGSGRGGRKALIGVALIAAAFIAPYAAPGLFATGGLLAGASGTIFGLSVFSNLAMVGTAMILGGISQMLSPQPKPRDLGNSGMGSQQTQPSYLIGGSLNVSTQGTTIPVQYGTTITGSVQISVGYEAVDISQGKTGEPPQAPAPPFFFGPIQFQQTQPTTTTTNAQELRSKAVVRILDLIGEGPIHGIKGWAKGILLDGTPLQADDGTMNFQGVTVDFRPGLPDQDPIPGFPSAETTMGINTRVTLNAPVIRTITDADATAVRVTIQIPALYDQDQKTGELRPTHLAIDVLIRPSRVGQGGFVGAWQHHVADQITSKATSPYQKSYRIQLPGRTEGANTWDIQVRRATTDSTSQFLHNDLYVQSITTIADHQLMYSNSALVALTFDAELFSAGTLPRREYIVEGRIVRVPANYDPVARTYATTGPGTSGGTWDAVTFKEAWTSNPAWCIYDLFWNQRYGCGLPERYLQMTRAELYLLSQYSDGAVPDGFGSVEPRFQINANISGQAEAYTMVQTMVSACRAMSYWGSGQVSVVTDMPKLPVKLVNQANVRDGRFSMESTSLKTRHNIVRVQWRDPAKRYEVAYHMAEDQDLVAQQGPRPTEIIAFGCTSRGQAERAGRWLIYSENYQDTTLTYEAGLYHMDLRPGDVFQQQDPAFVGLRWSGRLKYGTTNEMLHLDALLDLDTGVTFYLSIVMPDGSIEDRTLDRSGFGVFDGHTIVSLIGAPLPYEPNPQAVWIIRDQSLAPRLFQALTVRETERGMFEVQAVNHIPGKWDYVELGARLKRDTFSKLPELLTAALQPPTAVTARDYMAGVGTTTILRVTVSWSPPTEPRMTGFQVQALGTDTLRPFAQIYDTRATNLDIDNLPPGPYRFSVRTVGANGRASVWVSADLVDVDGKVDPPAAPLGFTAIGGTRRVFLSWNPVDRRDIGRYEIQRAPDLNGGPSAFTVLAYIMATAFVDSSEILHPKTKWWYRIRAVTTTGINGAVSQPAMAETSWLIADDLEDGIINTAKLARTIMVPEITDQIPTAPPQPGQSSMRFNTADGQLYTWNGAEWKSVAQTIQDAGVSVTAGSIIGQLTSDQIASLSAAKLTGQIVESQIYPGSITTPLLAAGAVQTANLAAGAITAETLSVAPASNLIWNSCCEISSEGWMFSTTANGAAGSVYGSPYDPTWRLLGFGTGYIIAGAAIPPDGVPYLVATWDPTYEEDGQLGVPFPSNVPIEAQARVGQHRCVAYIRIDFFNAQGQIIGATELGRAVPNSPGGNAIDGYHTVWTSGVSPHTTARARFVLIGMDDGAPDVPRAPLPPALFFTQTAIGVSVVNATQPQAWQPGGMTSITGQMVRARTIAGDRIIARSITGDKIVGNDIVAGEIAAAAIGAQEIAAGQIYTHHLAADFALISSAQIGTALINRAHIIDLEVGTSKIAYGATSDMSIGQMAAPYQQGQFDPYIQKTLVSTAVRVGPGGKALIIARIRTDGVTLPFIDPPTGGGES